MKVTLNWLRQYVDFDGSPEDLAERLTLLGLEVEGIQKLGSAFEGIVVGLVITRDKHPNADKLSLCRVQDGKGERQIVCGATNFKPGDKVALILPGASLPAKPGETPFTIKVGKIRGVESHGMMCSPKELGLAEDAEGLLILPPDAPLGQPFGEFLGRGQSDTVYDLEVTPNRPDLNSVIGIAREISALTGNSLRLPDPHLASGAVQAATSDPLDAIDRYITIAIQDDELCPRYVARLVRNVKIGPSPDWLRQTLEKVGVRSISNVVDVTNYVMLECGQPLHAFDYHLIAPNPEGQPTLSIRRAHQGESFTTLDGHTHTLTSDNLLIADLAKGIALAGVMGGQNSEINDKTADVLIESAYFKPANIRRTSKTLGLRTESSYRFERGCDPSITEWASRRAAQLILETAGGHLVPGVADVCPRPTAPHEIRLRHAKTNAILGIEIEPASQTSLLANLGLEVLGQPSLESTAFRIPTFRVDLKRETDLIEEICRLHGVNQIPATPPRGGHGSHPFDALHDAMTEARRLLTSQGLSEAQGQTLLSEAAASVTQPLPQCVRLAHPLSSDMNILRPSLLPGLLAAIQHNLHHQALSVALFELGRVFELVDGAPRERRRLAVALTGQRHPNFWSGQDRQSSFDLFDLKGILEGFLDQFGLRGAQFLRATTPAELYLETGALQLGPNLLGTFGQLTPKLARPLDCRAPVLLAELDLDQILARRQTQKAFKPLPSFPSSRRDVAMFVPESVTHEAVLSTIRQVKPAALERVELFDVFRGQNVPHGQKSLAYALTYRHSERTLTDAEVNAEQDKVLAALKSKLNATIRE